MTLTQIHSQKQLIDPHLINVFLSFIFSVNLFCDSTCTVTESKALSSARFCFHSFLCCSFVFSLYTGVSCPNPVQSLFSHSSSLDILPVSQCLPFIHFIFLSSSFPGCTLIVCHFLSVLSSPSCSGDHYSDIVCLGFHFSH